VRDTDREEIFKVISITACFLLDLVVLLLALEAIGGDRVDWITVNVLLPVASRLGVLGYAVLIAACYLTVVGAHVFVLDAVANRESAPRNSGRFSSDQLLDTLFYVLGDAAIHGAAILLLGLLTFGWWQGAFNPFAPTAMLCFAVVSMVSTWVVVSTSCVLNRCNDGWIQRLGQQLAQDPDPHRRLQAIEKLKNLGRWAKPVEDAIRGALNDKDSNVRQIAQDVVRRLK
jgi:hypothetical protein